MSKKRFPVWSALLALAMSQAVAVPARSATYDIDPEYSFIYFRTGDPDSRSVNGRFMKFSGQFDYDPAQGEDSLRLSLTVDLDSVVTGRADWDGYFKSEASFNVASYPEAKLVSTKYTGDREGGTLSALLTLRGETAPVDIEIGFYEENHWLANGVRVGFGGEANLHLPDFGFELKDAWLINSVAIYIEGVRSESLTGPTTDPVWPHATAASWRP